MSTRWVTPEEKTPAWVQIDLGKETEFNHIRLYWGAIFAASYEIMGSLNGENWESIWEEPYSSGGRQNLLMKAPCICRYVRLCAKESSHPFDGKMVLFAVELYQRNMQEIASRAVQSLELPQHMGREFFVPLQLEGVEITWSTQSPEIEIDHQTGCIRLKRQENPCHAVLTAACTAGDSSQSRTFPLHIRSQKDPAVDYCIYPTPQKITMGQGRIGFTNPVVIVADEQLDQTVRQRAQEVLQTAGLAWEYRAEPEQEKTNLLLGVYGADGEAQRWIQKENPQISSFFSNTEGGYDKHCLYVKEEQAGMIGILGEHGDAVFFALASLEQMLEQEEGLSLTEVRLEDYADTQYRGFIEGFYGYPWSMEDRISLMEYGKRYKMNVYIYGPKSDPYHLGAWRQDYPTEVTQQQQRQGQITQAEIRRLVEVSRSSHMDFVWSVHPAMLNGVDLTDATTVESGVDAVMHKFHSMYQLGVRGFALFVDDIDLEHAWKHSEMQAHMVNRIQIRLKEELTAQQSETDRPLSPLFYVPSYYALDFGKKDKREYNLKQLRTVDSEMVPVFTGGGCWSIVENQALNTFHSMVGRKVLMWWNYPVNDNIDDTLYMGPMDSVYSVSNQVDDLLGILSNPMNQAEASKIALFGVADYSWNTAGFDAQSNWERSFASVLKGKEQQEALRIFAQNSSVGQEPVALQKLYHSFIEQWEQGDCPPACARQLQDELEQILWACRTLSGFAKEGGRPAALWNEVAPWVNRLWDKAEAAALCIGYLEATEQEKEPLRVQALERMKQLKDSARYLTHSIKGHGTQLEEKEFPVKVAERAMSAFLSFAEKNILKQ